LISIDLNANNESFTEISSAKRIKIQENIQLEETYQFYEKAGREMLKQLKDKYDSPDMTKSDPIQLLTMVPKSWSA